MTKLKEVKCVPWALRLASRVDYVREIIQVNEYQTINRLFFFHSVVATFNSGDTSKFVVNGRRTQFFVIN